MLNSCKFNTGVECTDFRYAPRLCIWCGHNPDEMSRRKQAIEKRNKLYNSRHKYPLMLKIKHTANNSTYKVVYVKNSTSSQ